MKKLLLALALLWPLGAFAQTIGNLSGGSGGGGGGAVSSVSGTSGQVTCSPTTGSVICGLPSTITEALTFSGVIDTAAGSASTPGLAVGNSTTGFYSISTTGFGIAVNGTSQSDYGITISAQWYANGNFNAKNGIRTNYNSGTGKWNADIEYTANGITIRAGDGYFWSNDGTTAGATVDLGLYRQSSGVMEISSTGSAGAGGSLLLTNLTASGAVQGASYKVGSTAGASCAAGTLISSITVSNGIVTAITGTGC